MRTFHLTVTAATVWGPGTGTKPRRASSPNLDLDSPTPIARPTHRHVTFGQCAKALATVELQRTTDEQWTEDRVTPMLAGLLELLLTWFRKWHATPSNKIGDDSPATSFAGFLETARRLFELPHTELPACCLRKDARQNGHHPKAAKMPMPESAPPEKKAPRLQQTAQPSNTPRSDATDGDTP